MSRSLVAQRRRLERGLALSAERPLTHRRSWSAAELVLVQRAQPRLSQRAHVGRCEIAAGTGVKETQLRTGRRARKAACTSIYLWRRCGHTRPNGVQPLLVFSRRRRPQAIGSTKQSRKAARQDPPLASRFHSCNRQSLGGRAAARCSVQNRVSAQPFDALNRASLAGCLLSHLSGPHSLAARDAARPSPLDPQPSDAAPGALMERRASRPPRPPRRASEEGGENAAESLSYQPAMTSRRHSRKHVKTPVGTLARGRGAPAAPPRAAQSPYQVRPANRSSFISTLGPPTVVK